MPSQQITLIWALHDQKVAGSHHQTHAWKGVVAAHFNDLDLVAEKKKKPAERKTPQFAGYIYDPSTNKNIVLNEIEGRLLECNLEPWPLKKETQGVPRPSNTKMTIMIDNEARNGGEPIYANGDRAYPVGLSTVMPQPGQPSGMMMRHVWRDNINPPWGSLKDVNGVDCTLLTMYFITYGTVQDLTQNLPTYKFPVPATASGPALLPDFGVPKTSSMVVSQPPSSLVAQEFLSSEVAAEEVTPDIGTNAAVEGVGTTDGSASADGTASDSTTTFNGTASKGGTDPVDGTRQVDEGRLAAEGDGVAPIGENVPDPELGGDTIEDVEKEMDAEPEGEKDEEEVDIQARNGAVLKW